MPKTEYKTLLTYPEEMLSEKRNNHNKIILKVVTAKPLKKINSSDYVFYDLGPQNILSIEISSEEYFKWDLRNIPKDIKEMLIRAALHDKIVIGHDLMYLYALSKNLAARGVPACTLDTLTLSRSTTHSQRFSVSKAFRHRTFSTSL